MRKALVFILVAIMALTAVGCGGTPQASGSFDPSKTQIYVSVFNGGYGSQWLDDAANAYNATNDKYQIVVRTNKDEYAPTILPNWQAGVFQYDIYIGDFDVKEAATLGYIMDLTDVWNASPDNDGVTLMQKMRDVEDFKSAYGYNGKYYAIPMNDGIKGWVYDHEMFLENCFLFGQDGNLISSPTQTLSDGKDGIPGTYDDGQPETLAQWQTMLNAISQQMYAFQWTGKFTYYLDTFYEALIAEYDGIDNYMLNFSFDGTYVDPDTKAEKAITLENGYEMYHTTARKKAAEFIKTYLTDENLIHPNCGKSVSHTDAQSSFILGFQNTSSNPQSAMLYEGIWWENEARQYFQNLSLKGYSDYAYGVHDYRMMTLPDLGGEKTGNALVCSDNQCFVIGKQTDEAKLAACKDFLLFLEKTEWIKKFTLTTGSARPFNYDLTQEELSQMTKFSQYCWELYHDPNNMIIRDSINKKSSDAYYYGKITFTRSSTGTATAIEGIKSESVDSYWNASYNYFKTNWQQVVDAVNED